MRPVLAQMGPISGQGSPKVTSLNESNGIVSLGLKNVSHRFKLAFLKCSSLGRVDVKKSKRGFK